MNKDFQDAVEFIRMAAGASFDKLNRYLNRHQIFIFFLTKKMAGKSTYIQYLMEAFPNKFINLSFGQTVRDLQQEITRQRQVMVEAWGQEIIDDLETSSVEKLLSLPSVEAVLNKLISNLPENKSVLFDGLPRETNQISLVLNTVKNLTNRGIKTLFLEIDIADGILDARIESRRVCPQCGFTNNILTPDTDSVRFDEEKQTYYLICPKCNLPLQTKKGDKLSPAIYERRQKLERITNQLRDKTAPQSYIYLRTDVPCKEFQGNPEKELNMIANFSRDHEGNITVEREPQTAIWEGKTVYSLNPAASVVNIIHELSASLC